MKTPAHSSKAPAARSRKKTPSGEVGLGIKHLTLRLPSAPDFSGPADESLGLTKMRAMTELLSGRRLSIHGLLMKIIESADARQVKLPIPKVDPIPTGASFERIDVRLNQAQIQIDRACAGGDAFQPGPGLALPAGAMGLQGSIRLPSLLRPDGGRLNSFFSALTCSAVRSRTFAK